MMCFTTSIFHLPTTILDIYKLFLTVLPENFATLFLFLELVYLNSIFEYF